MACKSAVWFSALGFPPHATATVSRSTHTLGEKMLHCVFVISAGFLAPANIKHRSAAVPFARSPGLYASVPTEDFDDVELRFRDMEDAEKSAPAASTKSAQAFTKTSAPVVALMEKHSFPLGLAQRAVASAKNSPVRFWAVDNSGSMGIPDGQRLGKDSGGNFKVIQSTRWQELTDDIESVAALSSTIGSRTEFYLINPGASPPLIITGDGRPGEVEAVRAGLGAPTGTTPLAETTKRIADKISAMVDQSLLVGLEKACVVIATDGKPDDEGAFESAVKRLLKLPVWLVFRLCTNDDDVLGYYNELDAQREQPRVEQRVSCGTSGGSEHIFWKEPPPTTTTTTPQPPISNPSPCAVEADIEVIDDLHGEALEIAKDHFMQHHNSDLAWEGKALRRALLIQPSPFQIDDNAAHDNGHNHPAPQAQGADGTHPPGNRRSQKRPPARGSPAQGAIPPAAQVPPHLLPARRSLMSPEKEGKERQY